MRGLWKELWKSMHAIERIQFSRRKTSVLYFQGKKMLQE